MFSACAFKLILLTAETVCVCFKMHLWETVQSCNSCRNADHYFLIRLRKPYKTKILKTWMNTGLANFLLTPEIPALVKIPWLFVWETWDPFPTGENNPRHSLKWLLDGQLLRPYAKILISGLRIIWSMDTTGQIFFMPQDKRRSQHKEMLQMLQADNFSVLVVFQ